MRWAPGDRAAGRALEGAGGRRLPRLPRPRPPRARLHLSPFFFFLLVVPAHSSHDESCGRPPSGAGLARFWARTGRRGLTAVGDPLRSPPAFPALGGRPAVARPAAAP
jgi:hypothetical protein